MERLTYKDLRILLSKCATGPVEWDGLKIEQREPLEIELDGNTDPWISVDEFALLGDSNIQTAHHDFEDAGFEHLLLQEARNVLPLLLDVINELYSRVKMLNGVRHEPGAAEWNEANHYIKLLEVWLKEPPTIFKAEDETR